MSSHNKPGKFAEFDLDTKGDECVILWENTGPNPDAENPLSRGGTSGMRCYHYLNQIEEHDRRHILSRQAENPDPELPFFGGIEPTVGAKYLTFMGGRFAYGPFKDWHDVAAHLEDQGYEVSYTDKWEVVES